MRSGSRGATPSLPGKSRRSSRYGTCLGPSSLASDSPHLQACHQAFYLVLWLAFHGRTFDGKLAVDTRLGRKFMGAVVIDGTLRSQGCRLAI